MTAIDRRPEREARRERLGAIRKAVEDLEYAYLSAADLDSAGIHLSPMSLTDDDLLPNFFHLYKGQVQMTSDGYISDSWPLFDCGAWENARDLEDFLDKLVCHSELPQSDKYPIGPRYRDFGDFINFGQLLECRPQRWQVQAAWDMPDHHPHLKAMVINEAVGDERLLRGEVLTIIDIMRGRLTHKVTRAYVNAPILLFSFMDTCARALEAYLDGENLVIRVTRLYDFKTEEDADFSLSICFAKWWMGQVTELST
ncbi:hypothetical protein BO94DRAFT_507316 [Aspergillus sclerotioniger CBS 115572]|uniref:Uncharacterized protein n=1 Tax=Aspergillus sclerotioniger CBS 115572 TaxID=1450535 RepID=A0A317XBI9_9EURO|nr:hypothetical protein BO94DRAFT_507316 [Aspergillus sclerotioniger CBS 115572]PWY95913.1 hypothetical protein BO94DRAFT_507316 [Aspergillus sclerotioniger CBS 115572]